MLRRMRARGSEFHCGAIPLAHGNEIDYCAIPLARGDGAFVQFFYISNRGE